MGTELALVCQCQELRARSQGGLLWELVLPPYLTEILLPSASQKPRKILKLSPLPPALPPSIFLPGPSPYFSKSRTFLKTAKAVSTLCLPSPEQLGRKGASGPAPGLLRNGKQGHWPGKSLHCCGPLVYSRARWDARPGQSSKWPLKSP